MRVLIPTEDAGGMRARAHEHTGSAPYFTLVDIDTRAVQTIGNRTSRRGGCHGSGDCEVLLRAEIPEYDLVICRGMGRRALSTLQEAGLEVLVTRRIRVADIVDEFKRGEGRRLTLVSTCDG